MNDSGLDRRKRGRFRFMYMDFSAFWNRYILRKKKAQGPVVRPTVPHPVPKPPVDIERPGKASSSGLQTILEQHQAIREAILHLQKELRHDSAGHALLTALDHLITITNEHFRFEEAWMDHSDHPERQHHKIEHHQFKTQILQMRERAEAGDHAVLLELSSFLFNWLRNHTLQEDAAFSKTPYAH